VTKNQLRREASVGEDRQKGMAEHESYAMRCALAAGALLEGAELVDFQEHVQGCRECRAEYAALSNLITRELQPAASGFRQRLAVMSTKPLPYARERFLRRARSEGVVFSREAERAPELGSRYRGPIFAMAVVASLLVVAVGLTLFYLRETPYGERARNAARSEQIVKLNRENGALNASLSQLNESLAAKQREIQRLRAQLQSSFTTAENLRRNGEQALGEVERSTSRNAQLLDESRDQEKLLAQAKNEALRVNALRANDEASLVAEMVRVAELTDKLRIASATLDMERQLAANGQDVRELLAARQLHVIDVRDADPNGEPGKAFGRVFLTEGKSLTFYAFDLDEKSANTKRTFQVWAVPEASKNSARSLGVLKVDAKAPGRQVLKVENPELVKAITSVFVTVEPVAGGKQPSGQKLLYAYLGAPNHQ
jgi:anti-sigma-K factor RskA